MRKRDLAILLLSAFAIFFSLQHGGDFSFKESWFHLSDEYPIKYEAERLPPPIVADLNGDGKSEILVATHDAKIQVLEPHAIRVDEGFSEARLLAEISLLPDKIRISSGRRPVAMAAGFVDRTYKHGEIRKQVLVVVTSGWSVMCFDHNLKKLWENNLQEDFPHGAHHREISISISNYTLKHGDAGLIVVGGRMEMQRHSYMDLFEETMMSEKDAELHRRSANEKEASGNSATVDLRHFAFYAFAGRSGTLRWSRKNENIQAHKSDASHLIPQHNYKLDAHALNSRHPGEFECREFRESILGVMPHHWDRREDTSLKLAHFRRHKRKTVKKTPGKTTTNPNQVPVENHSPGKDSSHKIANMIGKAANYAGSAKSKKRLPYVPTITNHTQLWWVPNVIVAHQKEGIEAIHLATGRTICKRQEKMAGKKDFAWTYAREAAEGKPRGYMFCSFCNLEVKGGINRLKHHLGGTHKDIRPCNKVPQNVKDKCLNALESLKKDKVVREELTRNIGAAKSKEDLLREGEEISEYEFESGQGSNTGTPRSSGPMDRFMAPEPRQTTIENRFKKEQRIEICRLFGRFFYAHALPFNLINSPYLKELVAAIGVFGHVLKVPSMYEMRTWILKKEVEHTEELMKDHKKSWETYGCSIMSDGWTDSKSRSIINFLVNSPEGTVFLKSVDASHAIKSASFLFQLLDDVVEEVGEKNVVQVVTDNAANYVAAGKLLMEKRRHIFWTPCAAHCIDLILEDIGKMKIFTDVIEKAKGVTNFIYGHGWVLKLMRKYTNDKELLRPAVTRFATCFLTLQSLYRQQQPLIAMFSSEEFCMSSWAKKPAGIKSRSTVLFTKTFWSRVGFCVRMAMPLVCVLREVDSDVRPSMGFLYEAMDTAKEKIAAASNNKKRQYKPFWDIIDNRWTNQLHSPLHAAGYYLNPKYFYGENFVADREVKVGLHKCIDRMLSGEERENADIELDDYRDKKHSFGIDLAMSTINKRSPVGWWMRFGTDAPSLRKFAIRVLGLTCSASGCERNWSTFEQLHLLEGGLHADINGDGVLDHVQVVGGNGAEQTVVSGSMEVLRPCWAVATSGVPVREQLFNASICHHTHFNLFQHGDFARSFGRTADASTLEVATPILVQRDDGHKHRKGSHGDVVFLTSRGEVTSYSPSLHGHDAIWRWQLMTGATWSNLPSPSGMTEAVVVPTLKAFSLRAHDSQHEILAAGDQEAVVISPGGSLLTSIDLPGPPTHALILEDFSNDGLTDVIVVTSGGIYGFVQTRQPGALFFSTLVGCLIVIMGVIFVSQHLNSVNRGKPRGSTDYR